MGSNDSSITISIVAKDLASGNIGKAVAGLDALAKKGVLVGPILKGAGVAAAAGFGLATAGALQAEAAQGEWMAATGGSRAEAKKFVTQLDSIVGSAKTVGTSFDELVDIGTAVAQQFGLTGDAARDLTENIAGFAKVTGQDASDAAGQLEDTLSAFGLSADDAAGFMDQLVASSQKYGTDAGPATLGVLQGMAPALDAMGMSIGDGIELLNAFETAGLDAGAASSALDRAVKSLKPGEDLDTLIARLGAIEDPLLRAQEATRLFGRSAGPGLALLIKPGMTSLDDFGISVGEAAGAVGKAAGDMMTTSDTIKGALEKVGAGFRDVGQEFGPFATGAGAAGSAIAPVTGKLWEQVAALKEAKGGWIGLGASMGPLVGVSAGVAAGLYGVNEGLNKSNDGVRQAIVAFHDMSAEQRVTIQNTEVLGQKVPALTEHFANFVNFVAPWHQLAGSARDLANSLNAVAGGWNNIDFARHGASERADAAARRNQRGWGGELIGGRNRASGGPVGAHSIWEVAEDGPELLKVGHRSFLLMGGDSGYVDPPRSGGASGGAGVTLNVMFQSLAAPTAAEGQRIAQAIMPELVREMRRQRVL